MSEFTIRELTESDADAYRQVRLRMLRDHPEAFGSSYEEAVDQPLSSWVERLGQVNGVVVAAFNSTGEIVGSVGCVRGVRAKDRHRAMIWGVYVAPEARRRGIARALMTDSIACARTWLGVVQIQLTVVTENEAARRLYESLGFKLYGIDRRALKVGSRYIDEALMMLDLDGAAEHPS